jgi:hypothetical protein
MGCHGWLVNPCVLSGNHHCWTSQQCHPIPILYKAAASLFLGSVVQQIDRLERRTFQHGQAGATAGAHM